MQKVRLLILILVFGILILNSLAVALPVSSNDLWQGATVSEHSYILDGYGIDRIFDGQEGGYGYETGNTIFANGSDGTTHYVEWETAAPVTVKSINLTAYHDFDSADINSRGFSNFRLCFDRGSGWELFYSWAYSDPQNDLHYGGGPSHQFDPDPHDIARSYLELTANLDAAITAQFFRAEFDQYSDGWGPRVVELDAYDAMQPVPEPATMLLLGTGLIGLAGAGRKRTCHKSP